jgi:argininosuccinate lyase
MLMHDAEAHAADPLWKGRIAGPPDPEFFAFQRSLPFDARLLPYDLRLNAAWARALEGAGLLPAGDRARLVEALEAIGRELPAAEAATRDAEDVHTLVEAELTRRAGDLGRGIHRGKSRNDQVATDLRLWTADAADALGAETTSLAHALAAQATALADRGLVLPGYTHLQQAEPVLAAHWMLAATAAASSRCGARRSRPARWARPRCRARPCPSTARPWPGTSASPPRRRTRSTR